MTAHHMGNMGTLHRSREASLFRDGALFRRAGLALPAEGIWAAIGLVAAVIAPLVFGWGGAALPAVLFLILCPFAVAGVLIADAAQMRDGESGRDVTAD